MIIRNLDKFSKNTKNMKTQILILFLVWTSTQSFAQKSVEDGLVGSWKVIDSQLMSEMEIELDQEGKKKMEQMRIGWIGTVFTFYSNNNFKVIFSESIPEFMEELEFLDNKKWKIEDGTKIVIGNEIEGYNLMELIATVEQGKTYFFIGESPFMLEVSKQ